MEQLSNTISGVIENIEPLIVELASALGTTVEFVEQNFMFYLLEFGKYRAFTQIPLNLCLGILGSGGLGLAYLFLACVMFEDCSAKAEKRIFIIGFILVITVLLGTIFWDLICYLVSPEIYSITEAIEVLGVS